MSDKGIISFGQHYLENTLIQDVLVNSAALSKQDVVIEIGAGDGRITAKIADAAGKVIAYEIDEKTKLVLENLQKISNNIEIRFENFLSACLPKANKIVASLPYQITEPFLEKIKLLNFESVTLLVGKTFGQLADESAKQKITKLLLLFRCYFNGEYIQDVAKDNFSPPPNTMSSIIKMTPRAKQSLIENPALYIMREIFEQRDKKVSNALREGIIRFYAELGQTKTKREVKQLLQDGFDGQLIDCYLEQMNNEKIKELFEKISNMFEEKRDKQ